MSTLEERFWAKVDKTATCWLWTGARTAPGWHGVFAVDARRATRTMDLAHRVSWSLAFGPIPAGLLVLHSCDEPACVRPDHLSLGTQRSNMIDAGRKGRLGAAKKATHCKRGHAFAGNTVRHSITGRRMCHECMVLRQRARWAQIKDGVNARRRKRTAGERDEEAAR